MTSPERLVPGKRGRLQVACEALTVARAGGAIEHRNRVLWSAETVWMVEGHIGCDVMGES